MTEIDERAVEIAAEATAGHQARTRFGDPWEWMLPEQKEEIREFTREILTALTAAGYPITEAVLPSNDLSEDLYNRLSEFLHENFDFTESDILSERDDKFLTELTEIAWEFAKLHAEAERKRLKDKLAELEAEIEGFSA